MKQYMKNTGKQRINELALGKAIALFRKDPFETCQQMENYIKEYPADYWSYTFYASVLICLKRLDDAEVVLEEVYKKAMHNSRYRNNHKLFETFKKTYNYSLLKLLICREKYDEIYEKYISPITSMFSRENYKLDMPEVGIDLGEIINMRQVKYWCLKQRGETDINRRLDKPYLIRQIIDYRYDEFLKHAYRHMADFHKEPNDNLFVPGFPLLEVLQEVKKYIPSEYRLFSGIFADKYTFKYTGCGKCKNKTVDYFHVICFHGTTDLITIFPMEVGEYVPYIDLDYMNEKMNEDTKVKRLNQIEKFNKRYGQK